MIYELSVLRFIAEWSKSPFAGNDDLAWNIIGNIEQLIVRAISSLGCDYELHDGIAVHKTAVIEDASVVKGPTIFGAGSFVAAGAYIRGGAYVAENCVIGPGCELKSSLIFSRTKIAHFNFVGDSILGSDVNIEAGAIIANYRNEFSDKSIHICVGERTVSTGMEKFGSLIGDEVKIGANAVIAPGAIIPPRTKVGRLELIDQSPTRFNESVE